MNITFNLAGSQFLDFTDEEIVAMVGQPVTMVHAPIETKGKSYPLALSVRTEDDKHIGFIPEDSYKFKGHQGLYECLIFGFEVYGVVTEAMWVKDKRFSHLTKERVDAGNIKRYVKGEFATFEIELTITAGDESPAYEDDEGKAYLRLTRLLDHYKWAPDDHGLEEWSIQMFKNYDEYMTYLNGCAIDGQIIHHKAELALFKQALPEGVNPLPQPVMDVVKKVVKVHNTEELVFDKKSRVAGHYDGDVEVKGLKATSSTTGKMGNVTGDCILDWKRSRHLRVKMLRQIAFYAKIKGRKHAILVLCTARGEEKGEPQIIHLGAGEINKYYKQVVALAEAEHVITGV